MGATSPRVLGQDATVDLIQNGQVVQQILDIQSFETEDQLEILREGYLGETTDRRDMVYRGFSGRMSAHIENRQYLDFRQQIVNQARKRTPGLTVNIRVTLNFPGGPRVRIVLRDVKFGPMPLNAANRAAYIDVALTFEGSTTQII